jgi:hypothetical protein
VGTFVTSTRETLFIEFCSSSNERDGDSALEEAIRLPSTVHDRGERRQPAHRNPVRIGGIVLDVDARKIFCELADVAFRLVAELIRWKRRFSGLGRNAVR